MKEEPELTHSQKMLLKQLMLQGGILAFPFHSLTEMTDVLGDDLKGLVEAGLVRLTSRETSEFEVDDRNLSLIYSILWNSMIAKMFVVDGFALFKLLQDKYGVKDPTPSLKRLAKYGFIRFHGDEKGFSVVLLEVP